MDSSSPTSDAAMLADMEGLIAAMRDRRPAPPAPIELDSTLLASEPAEASDDASASASEAAGGGRLERGALVGRYVVLHRLGAGAMGVVYAAYDPELDRKLAIKLLLPGVGGESGRTRLLREAQTLAKLSHPNVVAIHDVGTMGAQVWLAMEFVQGQTLRQWLATPRGWRDVVEVLHRAGEGLAAAHAAELLHRDLKPDNVMIGDDGRVRVMDFGLARVRARASLEPRASHLAPSVDTLAMEVTRADEAPGTPAYMPPEQFDRRELTAATDQFAFCVTLWEALHGRRPFTGNTKEQIVIAILAGDLRPAPKQRRGPAWLLRACQRGLAADPARRWPSMRALLDVLATGRTRDRMRKGLAALGVLALVGVGAEGWRRLDVARRTAACEATRAEIETAWSPARETALREGLLATEARNAATTADKTVPWLEQQARAWGAARVEACLDAEVRDRWDPELLDRSLWCLDERREELQRLVDELTTADARVLQTAVLAASGLTAVDRCRDEDVLARQIPPSTEDREQAREIGAEVIMADTLLATGDLERGVEVARGALARAEAVQWAPLSGAARLTLGVLLRRAGDDAAAEATLEEAYFDASDAELPELQADAATELVFVVGHESARHEDGQRWGRHAEAALAALRDDEQLRRFSLLTNLATVHEVAGDYDRAQPLLERAVAIAEAALGPEHPMVARALDDLAIVHKSIGDYERARALYERALSVLEQALGPDHPDVAASLSNLAIVHRVMGDYARALALYQRAISIQEQALGVDHPVVGKSLTNLAAAYQATGDHDRAEAALERASSIFEHTLGPDHLAMAAVLANLANTYAETGRLEGAKALYERALSIYQRKLGPDHEDVATVLANLGSLTDETGDHVRARALLEQALRIRERALGPDHDDVATTLFDLASTSESSGDLEAAERLYERALAIRERALGPEHPRVLAPMLGLASVALARGAPERAASWARRAMATIEDTSSPAHEWASACFLLARALWGSGHDRHEAVALAEQAHDAYRAAGAGHGDRLAEVDAWLAEHRDARHAPHRG